MTIIDTALDTRKATHNVHNLILGRWSPRAMSGESIPLDELLSLFEAARWAPSSYNDQPWRFVYAVRDSEHWVTFMNFLVEFNQQWCKNAAALVIIFSRTGYMRNDKPNASHSFSAGSAMQNMMIEATSRDIVTHAMGGFSVDAVRNTLNVPELFAIEAMVAIGRPSGPEVLPENMRDGETPSDREPLSFSVSEGTFSFP